MRRLPRQVRPTTTAIAHRRVARVVGPSSRRLPGQYTVPSPPGDLYPLPAAPRIRVALLVPIAVAFALAACPTLDNPFLPLPEPSYDEYVAYVQPIVGESCASLGCHGANDRTLTLYATDYLRATTPPGTPLDPDHLTPGELRWNYDGMRMRLVDETSADTAVLLLKNLDPAEGGIEHGDGLVVFESREDPDFQTLRDWIEGGL